MKLVTVQYHLNMLLERKVLRFERVGRRRIYVINDCATPINPRDSIPKLIK